MKNQRKRKRLAQIFNKMNITEANTPKVSKIPPIYKSKILFRDFTERKYKKTVRQKKSEMVSLQATLEQIRSSPFLDNSSHKRNNHTPIAEHNDLLAKLGNLSKNSEFREKSRPNIVISNQMGSMFQS